MQIDAPQATEVADVVTAAPQEEVAPSETNSDEVIQDTADNDIGSKPDNELTPEQLAKRHENRISHEKSKAARFKREAREAKAEMQRIRAEIEALKQGNQPKAPAESQEPKLDDFETWEDYNKALIRFEAKQIRETENKQTQETQANQELAKWADERSQRVDTRIAELAQTIPDFEQAIDEIEDLLSDTFGIDVKGNVNLPPEIARLALEADDINLAAYTLQREGKLLEVLNMPPVRAAMEIAKAEVRGAAYLKQPKATSNAPAPMSAAKGNKIMKSEDSMSGAELLKKYGFK